MSDQASGKAKVSSKGDSVYMLGITDANKIVMVTEWRQGIQDDVWQLPGGKPESDNLAKEAVREFIEETGYSCDPHIEYLGAWAIEPCYRSDTAYVFVAGVHKTAELGELITEEFSFAELIDKMRTQVEILDPISCLAIVLYTEKSLGWRER